MTDQGSQFTSVAFLIAAKIAISMDGKGAWRDNVFVERLWRTIKYEEVYLRAYRSVSEARRGLDRYLAFYNRRRPHSSLGGQTPSGIFQPANAKLGGGITSAEIHLSIAHKLFKIDEPPLTTVAIGVYAAVMTTVWEFFGREFPNFALNAIEALVVVVIWRRGYVYYKNKVSELTRNDHSET